MFPETHNTCSQNGLKDDFIFNNTLIVTVPFLKRDVPYIGYGWALGVLLQKNQGI